MTLQQWNDEIDRLEDVFKNMELPKGDIVVKEGIIHDLHTDINTNIACARTNAGNPVFIGCILRLQELEALLSA